MPLLQAFFGRLPRVYWLLWLGSLVNRLTGFIVPFLAAYLTRVRGQTAATAGALVACYGAGSLVSTLVGGMLADRLGRKRTMLLGLIGSAAAALGLGFSESLAALAVSVVLCGFFGESYGPAIQAMVADVVPEAQRTRAFALLYWAVNIGFAVGMLLAGALANANMLLLFVADASTTLAFAAIIAAFVPESRPPSEGGPSKAGPLDGSCSCAPLASPEGAGRATVTAELWGMIRVFRDGRLVRMLALWLLTMCAFVQFQVGLPIDAASHGVSPGSLGPLLALNCLLIVFLQPLASRIAEKVDRGALLALAAVLVGAGFGLYAFGHSIAFYAAGVVLWTMGEILGNPMLSAIAADLSPADKMGRYQGAVAMTWSLANLLGPLLGGGIITAFGSRTLWLCCFGSGGLVGLGHMILTRPMLRAMSQPRTP